MKSPKNTMLELAMSSSNRVPVSNAHAISEKVETSKAKAPNKNWDTHLFGMASRSDLSDDTPATIEGDEDLDPTMLRVSSALLAEQRERDDNEFSRSHTEPN